MKWYDRYIGISMRIALAGVMLVVLIALMGCAAAPGVYMDVGVGYQIDSETDYWLQTTQSWQCSKNAAAHVEVGYEWDNGTTLGLNHQSWWMCGTFNNDPEVYSNQILLNKRFGGR
jgi:hypothetical protein